MTIFSAMDAPSGTEDDMARAAVTQEIVDSYVNQFQAAGADRAAFERVLCQLSDDPAPKSVDVVAIAVTYRGGGTKPRSRRAAIELISQRFVEIARTSKKNAVAERVRPW